MSDLDLYAAFAAVPEGVPAGADAGAMVTGRLLGLDAAAGLVQVSYAGSEGFWVPAAPEVYPAGATVRLLRSPLDGGRITYCLGPVKPGPRVAPGVVKAVNASSGLLTVSALGGEHKLPYLPGTYGVGAPVHVLRGAYGTPELVLGTVGNYVAPVPPEQPGGGDDNEPVLVQRQAVILPEWSGSWRAAYSRWDSWNTSRYGGRSTLWQGNGYGSGPMTGLATYGNRITDLRAEEILSIRARVWRADSSTSSGRVAVLQPSPEGGRPGGAPAVSGATASSRPLPPGQSDDVTLPGSVLDGFRTGAFRGLATVGGDYAGFNGTPDRDPVRADGMALMIQYRVRQ